MKHDPQQPIRPRLRGASGTLASAGTAQQPSKRVVIRVPLIETKTTTPSAPSTTAEQSAGSTTTTAASTKPPVSTSQTPATVERTIRIEAAHTALPAPHATAIPAKLANGWWSSVLQKRTLLAVGLVVSILVLAVVVHQRSGHEAAAESAPPHPKLAKSERHASLVRKAKADNVSDNLKPWNPPRATQMATAAPPIIRQSLGTEFNNGPALSKSDAAPAAATATATNAAANAPAMLGAGAEAANTELRLPEMPNRTPPREALAPPINSGTAEPQFFGFAPGEGTSAVSVAARGGASFAGGLSNSHIPAPTVKK